MTTPARVLIVEDDDQTLQMLACMISAWGYDVATATNGVQALASIQDVCPAVVISDLMMPGMSGLELLNAIKTERKECVIFFVLATGYGTGQRAVNAIFEGADEVILKPIHEEELHEILLRHGFKGVF